VRASANPAKAKGTAWESALVGYLREHHNPGAHRNVQMGSRDIGDIDGYYLHALEAKAEKAITLADYIAQANREAIHAGMPFGCAVVKRRMKGVQDGYVVRDVRTDVRLLNRMRDMEAALQGENSALYEALDKQHREAA
jgi:glycosylphosphatidylinositol transamidase (GPIT) subunit GPI8